MFVTFEVSSLRRLAPHTIPEPHALSSRLLGEAAAPDMVPGIVNDSATIAL